jgi:hypothetical protein
VRPRAFVVVVLLASSGCGSNKLPGTATTPDTALAGTGGGGAPLVAEDEPGTEEATTIGLWVVPQSQVDEADARAKAAGEHVFFMSPNPFYFHGDSATMHLIRLKEWMWRSEDDYYRVKTKWEGDDLYWLPPFGPWSKLATFRNGRFERDEDDVVWKFERISPKVAADECRPLLKKREIHDYAIRANGSRDPSRLKKLDLDPAGNH